MGFILIFYFFLTHILFYLLSFNLFSFIIFLYLFYLISNYTMILFIYFI